LGLGAWFGYSIWYNTQQDFYSSASGRLIGVVQQAVRKSPNDISLRIRLGEAYAAANKYQPAVEEFNAASRIDPKSSGALLDLGQVAMLNNDNTTAEGYLKKLLMVTDGEQYAGFDQAREQGFYYLGQLKLDEKQYADAAGYFKGALGIRNDSSDTYYGLAKAYQALGDVDSAIEQLNFALQFDPGFAEAHYYLGQLYQSKHDDVNAAYQYKKAAELAPDADPPKQALDAYGTAASWVSKANAAAAANNLPQAIIDIEVARVLDNSNFSIAKRDAELAHPKRAISRALSQPPCCCQAQSQGTFALQAQIKKLQQQVPQPKTTGKNK